MPPSQNDNAGTPYPQSSQLKIGVVPTASPAIRGSYTVCMTTIAARMAASERRTAIGRCMETHAVPSDIRARAIESMPLSSANVSASASALSVPVANSATEICRPGRCSRLPRSSVATPKVVASITARIAKGTERSRWAMRA